MSHSKQPDYYLKAEKLKAREAVVEKYRELSGNQIIPINYQYWTLCNHQPDHPDSEINQLTAKGLITKSQFYGVDYDLCDEGLIESNRRLHPEANFIKGDWLDVITEAVEEDWFKPALIYFDYTFTVSNGRTSQYIAKTMNLCREANVVVAANAMVSNGHNDIRYDSTDFGNDIWHRLWDKSHWRRHALAYQYRASQTDMRTFWFHRLKD